jgi:hypothetical protein
MSPVIEQAIAQAISRDDAARKHEARKLTADGWLWPVRRADMRHKPTIRDRMAEDLSKFALGSGANAAALDAAGWTLAQIEAHAERAIAVFFEKPFSA